MDDKELDNFIAKFKESRILQDTIVDALSEKTKIHNVKFLIDTYGVYIGAKRFWRTFSNRRTHWAIEFIATRALEMLRTGYEVYSPLSYSNLIREYQVGKICLDLGNDLERIQQELKKYDGILRCKFSYFYAAAPDDSGAAEKRVLTKISDGELGDREGKLFIDSLKHYPNFINHLKSGLFTKGGIQKGHLQVLFDDHKIKPSEKEVDTLLTIEAMDLLHGEEFQEVVLVSNDSDFNPLGNRFWGTETKFSQVDLGNIIQGFGDGRLKYKADLEILEHVRLDIILRELMEGIVRSENVQSYKSKVKLSPDEIEKIQDFLNKNGSK